MSDHSATTTTTGGVKYLYMSAAFVIVVAGMRAAEIILNPLLLAIFLSVISAPAYFGLLRRGVSNWLALLTVIGVLGVMLFSVVFVVTQSIAGFTAKQEHYRERLTEEKDKVVHRVQQWVPAWAKAKAAASPDTALDDNEAEDSASEDLSSVSAESGETQRAVEGDISPPLSLPDSDESESATADTDVESMDSQPAPMPPKVARSRRLGFPRPHVPLPENEQSWREYMSEQFDPGTVISLAASVAGSIGQLLSNAFLILLTVIFILLEAGGFTAKMKDAFVRTEEATTRAQEIIDSLQHYIVIKTWVSLGTGILIFLWLKFLGVSHAPLWGLLAFFFNYIPNVGSVLAAVPAVLVAWLELTWLPAVACAVGFVIVNGVIGNFIEPRLMGRSLGLSALVVFCSMVFWGWVLGPIGMLLSVPLTMTARIVMDGFDDTKWIATLMGNAEHIPRVKRPG